MISAGKLSVSQKRTGSENRNRHDAMSPRRILLLVLAVAGALVVVGLAGRGRPTPPPVAVTFNGLLAGAVGVLGHPFGSFTITNRTARTVQFSALGEAPTDADLFVSQLASSMGSVTWVQPHGVTQIRCLVADKPGVPFRAAVQCYEPADILVQIWTRFSRIVYPLRFIWDPPPVRLRPVYSDWHTTPRNAGELRGRVHRKEQPK